MSKKTKVVLVAALVAGIVLTAMGFAFTVNKNVVSANPTKSNYTTMATKGHGFGGKIGRIGPNMGFGKIQDEVATYLGISMDTLKTELKDGKSLVEIAEANGKNEQGLIDFITGKIEENLKTLLDEGKIDQAHYNEATANIGERVKTMVEKSWKGFVGYHHKWMCGNGFKPRQGRWGEPKKP